METAPIQKYYRLVLYYKTNLHKQKQTTMKRIFLSYVAIVICVSAAIAQPQSHKKELVDKIEEKHDWLYAYAVEKTVTANLSESMWAMILGESRTPKGYSTFKRMGKAFTDFSDKMGGTVLEKKCGFNVNDVDQRDNESGCRSVMDGWKGKYSMTLNAPNVQAGNDAFTLVMGYLSSVAIYLEDGSASLWQHGYAPKSDKLHIIINADNKYKTLEVNWNTDGSTVTINGPADIQTLNWDGKIEKGLQKGWKKV